MAGFPGIPRTGVNAKTLSGLAGALLAGLVLFVVVIGGAVSGGGLVAAAETAGGARVCVGSGPVRGLSAAQAQNARTVVAVAEQLAGRPAAVIAITVGLAESGLRVLGNPGVPGSDRGQGEGADHDSVGIFQQRASWGSLAARLDPASATRLFIARLLADPGWQAKPPWVAAQDVQVSAYDGTPRAANQDSPVYGGNYQATLTQAQRIVTQVGVVAGGGCGALAGGQPANPAAGSHGLPADYTIPATATPTEATVVGYALAQLDKPYVFDAAGPDAFDCSGLTMAAWAQVGVILPHWTVTQAQAGTPVSDPNLISPGDLILVPGDDGTLAAPGHVGLFIGDGLVVNAADPADGIRVQTFANFVQVGHGLSTIRHLE